MIDVNYILIMFHPFTITEYIINNVTRMINVNYNNLINLTGTRTEEQCNVRTHSRNLYQLSLWNKSKSLART